MSIQMGFQAEDFTAKTWRAVAAEFIATGMFVFLGVGAVVALKNVVGSVDASFVTAVAIAHGLGIMLAVAVTARISGGHINPAVTFSQVLTGRMKVSTGLLYVVAQCIAAVLAVLLIKTIIAGPYEMGLGAHGINKTVLDDQVGNGAGAGLLLEVAMTFVLVFVVYATAIDPKGPGHLAPAAIGLAVLADHFVGVPLTGASMNPARSFGPAVVANVWSDHWIYWLGPLIGAAIAALVYENIFLTREEAPG